MTSQEYIEEYPRISVERARRILQSHDYDATAEGLQEILTPGGDGLIDTQEIFNWLGY